MNKERYCSSKKQRVIFKRITGINFIQNNYVWKETTSKLVSEILPNNHLLCETIIIKILFINTPVVLTKAKQVANSVQFQHSLVSILLLL